MSNRSVHIVATGRVQGVGYRWFITQKAVELNITGWIRNLPNDDVELVAHGNQADMQIFIDWVKIGPARARVIKINLNDFVANSIPDSFSVR